MIRVHSTWASGASAMAVPGWPELARLRRVHGQAPDDVDAQLLEVAGRSWLTVPTQPMAALDPRRGRWSTRRKQGERHDGAGPVGQQAAVGLDRAELGRRSSSPRTSR